MEKQWTIIILLGIILIGFIASLGVVYVLNWENENVTIGNGNVVSQERSLEGFDSIDFDGIGEVKVHPGESYKVVVTTDNNIQDKIITKVDGKTLHITESGKFNINDGVNVQRLTIDVYLPELKNVSLKGAGDMEILNGSGSELQISLSGLGNINAENYQVQNVNVTHSGAGDMKLWVTQTLNADLSGLGSIDALKSSMVTANVTVSGAGDIKLWVSESLKGEIRGLGSIFYKGNPSTKDVKINGVGSITQIN